MDGSEAKTVAYFTPPSDSPYYENFIETVVPKTNGLDSTASYLSKESMSDGTLFMKLGNNGRLDVEMGIVKTGSEIVKANGTIQYSVTIYNYTDEDKTANINSEGSNKTNITVPAKGTKTEEFTANAPNARVPLPVMSGFAPNDNKNPQLSTSTLVFNHDPKVQDHGNYAWMVFPQADYYIVATKAGYEAYTSPILSVEWDIIKHDFAVKPLSSGGENRNITRAEIAAIFTRILEIQDLAQNEPIYKDVKTTSWYAKEIEAASKNGLLKGYEDNTFRPDLNLKRSEAVKNHEYYKNPDTSETYVNTLK